MNLNVRRMEWADLPAVLLIDVMCFSLPWTLSAYMHEMKNPLARPWVVETVLDEPLTYKPPEYYTLAPIEKKSGEKAIVAAAVVWLIIDEAHIATIAVHPEMRLRGVGRELLKTVLDQCAKDGAVTAMLEVRAGNVAAQELYKSFGFEEVGRRPHYYHDNFEDAILMTLQHLNVQTSSGDL